MSPLLRLWRVARRNPGLQTRSCAQLTVGLLSIMARSGPICIAGLDRVNWINYFIEIIFGECWTPEMTVLLCGRWKTNMEIINKTKKPLSVPLPGGKKLFLGPGKIGQVAPKALEYPALVKLLEAGDIERSDGGAKRMEGAIGKGGQSTGSRHAGTGAMRQSGDR